VVNRMPSALANRFVHITVEVDLDDWVAWAMKHEIRPELIAFLRWRPELLFNFDPKKNEKAFATPRSNAKLSKLIDVCNGDISYELAAGVTGDGHATEFLGFLRIFKSLPDPDLVITKPDLADVPTDPATLFAICGALAQRANDKTFANIIKYSNRIPMEYGVLLVRDCISKDEELLKTRSFIEWSAKHSDIFV